jgi:hypothetical protein
MKQLRARKGPFVEQPFYALDEIDRLCSEELQAVDLYPKTPGPVRIERFIEKRFGVTPVYEDLDARILGFTRFGREGVQEVVISKTLASSDTVGAIRCLSSTLAHEAGHILLHGYLFAVSGTSSLFENSKEPAKIMCRDINGTSPKRAYDGCWWEYQANRAIGGLLLPRALALRCIVDLLERQGGLGLGVLASTRREETVQRLARVFEVNPVVARIRLGDLYPSAGASQLTL